MLVTMVIVAGIVLVVLIIAIALLIDAGKLSLKGGQESQAIRTARENVAITQYEAQKEYFQNAKDLLITARQETPPEAQLAALMELRNQMGKDVFGKPGAPVIGELLPPKSRA